MLRNSLVRSIPFIIEGRGIQDGQSDGNGAGKPVWRIQHLGRRALFALLISTKIVEIGGFKENG